MPRPKGSPNKITAETRAFLRAWLEANETKAQLAWESIEDPADKFSLWLKAAEFVHPKLGRQEITGTDGGAISFKIVKATDAEP